MNYIYFFVCWRGFCAGNLIPPRYKNRLSIYRDSHYKDKTLVRPAYLYDGNSCTGKTPSVYWDGPFISNTISFPDLMEHAVTIRKNETAWKHKCNIDWLFSPALSIQTSCYICYKQQRCYQKLSIWNRLCATLLVWLVHLDINPFPLGRCGCNISNFETHTRDEWIFLSNRECHKASVMIHD